MDYARREIFLTFRRLLAAALCVWLLVAFWADRPTAAASRGALPPEALAALNRQTGAAPATEAPAESSSFSPISLLRRPWLAFYTAVGAPPLDRGPLDPDASDQFRSAIFRLTLIFFALGGLLWWRGQHLIVRSRHR
jgi:hypothetical protein